MVNDSQIALAAVLLSSSKTNKSDGWEKQTPVKRETIPLFTAGRNDQCPCGSGQKFKRCCIGKSTLKELEK